MSGFANPEAPLTCPEFHLTNLFQATQAALRFFAGVPVARRATRTPEGGIRKSTLGHEDKSLFYLQYSPEEFGWLDLYLGENIGGHGEWSREIR